MNQKRIPSALLGVTVALLLAIGTSGASMNPNLPQDDPPAVDGAGWTYFSFGGLGATVSLPAADALTELRVTDAYCYGDRFLVTADGNDLGETSEPGSSACGGPASGQAAYDDPDMSSGCFLLPLGATSLTLTATASPFGAGGAFYRIDPVLTQADSPCLPL